MLASCRMAVLTGLLQVPEALDIYWEETNSCFQLLDTSLWYGQLDPLWGQRIQQTFLQRSPDKLVIVGISVKVASGLTSPITINFAAYCMPALYGDGMTRHHCLCPNTTNLLPQPNIPSPLFSVVWESVLIACTIQVNELFIVENYRFNKLQNWPDIYNVRFKKHYWYVSKCSVFLFGRFQQHPVSLMQSQSTAWEASRQLDLRPDRFSVCIMLLSINWLICCTITVQQ